jgi:PPOX class probable F420-dependent enzyme
MSIGDEKYVQFTTYKRSGDPVATPVWLVTLDSGDLGFWTSSGSGKAKRLAHTPKVLLQPSDARGTPKAGSLQVTGTARLAASDDPAYAEVQQKVKAKYGFMTHITKALGTVGGMVKRNRIPYGDRAVVITLD